jgi:hypothetical protein
MEEIKWKKSYITVHEEKGEEKEKEGRGRFAGGGGGGLERVDHKKMAELERQRSVVIGSLEVMEFPETPWVK